MSDLLSKSQVLAAPAVSTTKPLPQSLAAGASDFLSKPFSTTELHVRVKNLIESHEYQRKLGRQNQILEATLQHRPNDATALRALAVYLQEAGQPERAVDVQRELDTLLRQ